MTDLLVHGGRREASSRELVLPSDKSISHRVLCVAAAVRGPTRIRDLNRSESVRVLVDGLPSLGVDIADDAGALIVGTIRHQTGTPRIELGSSSAAARLLLGQLAGMGVGAIIDGDASLRARPMDWVVDPLNALGANVTYAGRIGGVPVITTPARMHGGEVTLAVGSAQARSAVLLAAVMAEQTVRIRYPVQSRDHTERLLRHLGIRIDDADHVMTVHGAKLPAIDELRVPNDPSALAFLAAAHVLSGHPGYVSATRVCLNETRTGFLALLRQMGVEVRYEDVHDEAGEPVGTVYIGPKPEVLKPFTIDAAFLFHALIDEVPIAFALATAAAGRSVLEGGAELVFKETNRLESTCAMLAAFGAAVETTGHQLVIEGGRALHAATAPAFGDHRIAMTAAVLGTTLPGTTRVIGGDCFVTSFPEFVTAMQSGGWNVLLEHV